MFHYRRDKRAQKIQINTETIEFPLMGILSMIMKISATKVHLSKGDFEGC